MYFCKKTTLMATNLTNNQNGTLDNEVQTVPLSTAGTGTITTSGIGVVGSGTSFTTELSKGAWIFNDTDEIRRVNYVESDTVAYLEDAFSSEFSADAFSYIKSNKSQCKSISVAVPLGEANATINGGDLVAGRPVTNEKTGNSNNGSRDFVNPVIIDATSTLVDYSIQY